MTYSVFAIDSNEFSPSGCAAYTYTLGGMLTYMRAPWYQFSEQAVDDIASNGGQNPAFPFLTGHGGASQIVPFGYLGVRTDQDVLYIDPSLPPQIPQVRIRDIYFGGAGISSFMNQTHTAIRRFDTSLSKEGSALVDRYANTSMPIIVGRPDGPAGQVLRHVRVNETIVVNNRLYFRNLTYPGNLIQCLPVSSASTFNTGQYPAAATDGSAATLWQPDTDATSSLTVNMSTVSFQPLGSLYLNWAGRPARNATIYLGNSTGVDADQEIVISLLDIGIDVPYNASEAPIVEPYIGNSTTINLLEAFGPVWTGDYARLEVQGSYEDDGSGATVAEFVLLKTSDATK